MIMIAEVDKLVLNLPGYWIMEYLFEMTHHWLQNLSYHNTSLKSIHKKQQNYFFNSTSITANDALLDYELNNRHILSLALPLVSYKFCRLFNPSLYVSQEWKMISFWAETPFWVSIYHGHPVLPVNTQIPPELKGDQAGAPLCHGGTTLYFQFPAAHGLGVKDLTFPCLSIHAALVLLKKNEPRRTRKAAKKNIRPRMEQSIGLNHITHNEQSPEPAQGMIHTLSLAPKGVLIQGETFMIKHYRMIIDLTVNISERITPEIIEKAKENCSTETDFCPRQEYLDMSQDIITYIIGRPDLHIECIYASLLFKLFSYNADEDLNITDDVDTALIENNMMIAAEALGPRYVTFINKVYQLPSEEDDDDNLPAAKSNIIVLADAKAKPKDMPREERDILIDIIQLCLMDCTINSSNLEPAAEETNV